MVVLQSHAVVAPDDGCAPHGTAGVDLWAPLLGGSWVAFGTCVLWCGVVLVFSSFSFFLPGTPGEYVEGGVRSQSCVVDEEEKRRHWEIAIAVAGVRTRLGY